LTRPKAELLQGTLDLLILKALSIGPLHGYGIIQRIRQLSDELLEVEQGSLYPADYRTLAARLDQFQVGSDRDRPPGQFLHANKSGK
jgi:PadR family transcriptional regulator, regulatory protein PadR